MTPSVLGLGFLWEAEVDERRLASGGVRDDLNYLAASIGSHLTVLSNGVVWQA